MVKFLKKWKTLGRVSANAYLRFLYILKKALTILVVIGFCQKSTVFGTDGTK